jgi:hypothetical protein
VLKICKTVEMMVRIWGGPKDGQFMLVSDGAREWKVPVPLMDVHKWLLEPEPSPEPTFTVETYKIMNSPVGWVAVHPSINTGPLT